MGPLNIKDEIDKLRGEITRLQAKRRAAATDEEDHQSAELQAKIAETRWEMYVLKSQSTTLAQQVADMLQQQQDAIIAAAMQSVWTQVQLWPASNNVGQIPTHA